MWTGDKCEGPEFAMQRWKWGHYASKYISDKNRDIKCEGLIFGNGILVIIKCKSMFAILLPDEFITHLFLILIYMPHV